MSSTNHITIEKLAERVREMRVLQKKRDSRLQFGAMLPVDERRRLSRLQYEVDNMLLVVNQKQTVIGK